MDLQPARFSGFRTSRRPSAARTQSIAEMDFIPMYTTAIDDKSWRNGRFEVPFSGAIIDLCMYTSNTEYVHKL